MADAAAMRSGANRVPVTVLTGFLGAGKTTILNRLLRQPGMEGAAVIINEFGEVGIDHMLVEKILGEAVLLDSGCLCCSLRGDLVDTMNVLRLQAEAGDLPRFDRLLVETTGLADPAPVLQTLMAEPMLTPHYRLSALVTAVDAANGAATLDGHAEAVKQAALASLFLLTKTDIAPAARIAEIEARLRAINPQARIERVIAGEIDAARFFAAADYDADATGLDTGPEIEQGPIGHRQDDAADHGHGHEHAHSHRHADDGITTFCILRDRPLPWAALSTWLDSLTSIRGADLLRVKGIVDVEGCEAPVVIHGVQHVFHPPETLARWPADGRGTRIVCIARGLDAVAVSNALDAAVEKLRH
jgi:G3E family GTPase